MLPITNKQIIELVSSDSPTYIVHIYGKEKFDIRHASASIYAHGVLEETLGYDILHVINVNKFPSVMDEDGYDNIVIEDGVYEAMVVGGSVCRAYIWNTPNRIIGIVVRPEDEEAIKYAEEKYLSRVAIV